MTAPASGVSGSLPYDIDTWLPVSLATAAIATSLPLSPSGVAVGLAAQRSGAAALTAPLTVAAGAAAARRSGVGAACTLSLTAAPATGTANAQHLAAAGQAITLPFTQVNRNGVKQVSLQAGSLGLLLVDIQGSGSSFVQASGLPVVLTTLLSVSTASKHSGSPGNGADLWVVLPAQAAGTRYEWTFQTPTDVDPQPFSPIYPNTLWYAIPYGMTVWQDADGAWHQMRGPNPTRLSGALRIYEGGRLHILSADDMAILTAAGYADNIILQEMH